MWGLLLRCSFLLLVISGIQAQDSDPSDPGVQSLDVSIIFNEEDVIVNPDKRLELQCGVVGPYRNCYWEKEDGQIFQVEDVHANLISGMTGPEKLIGNECGIVLRSTTTHDHGKWMCKIFVIGSAMSKTKNVIVTITPSKPKLEINNGNLVVDTKSEQTITCSVARARPSASISWYLDSEDITHRAKSESSLTDPKGIYKTISTLTRQFAPTDNDKRLICSVQHYTLAEPTTAVVDVDVRFAPVPQDPVTFYEVKVGSDFDISVNFSSNPPPKYVSWSYGDSYDKLDVNINVPGIGPEGKYMANDLVLLPSGIYSSLLRINGFTEDDELRKFSLTIENDLGRTDYHVMLSMDEAPRDDDIGSDINEYLTLPQNNELEGSNDESASKSLSAGAVAAIIIIVVLVAFVLLVAAYAKYNQMYCFGQEPASVWRPRIVQDCRAKCCSVASSCSRKKSSSKDDPEKQATPKIAKEEHSDTESARAPSTNKGQDLFKSLNKNISSIKIRLSKQKKDDAKVSQMEEGTPQEDKEKDKKEKKEEREKDKKDKKEKKEKKEKSKGKDKSGDKLVDKEVPQTDEVVYAELDLGKEESKKIDVKVLEKTEYAEIIGTVPNNREEEKKE